MLSRKGSEFLPDMYHESCAFKIYGESNDPCFPKPLSKSRRTKNFESVFGNTALPPSDMNTVLSERRCQSPPDKTPNAWPIFKDQYSMHRQIIQSMYYEMPEVLREQFPHLEPKPTIDYAVIKETLARYGSILTKRDLKRWDYVLDARNDYYTSIMKTFNADVAAQDSQIYLDHLNRKRQRAILELEKDYSEAPDEVLAVKRRRLHEAEKMFEKESNAVKFVILPNLHKWEQNRDCAAQIFSEMKYKFLEVDGHKLRYLATQIIYKMRETGGKQWLSCSLCA